MRWIVYVYRRSAAGRKWEEQEQDFKKGLHKKKMKKNKKKWSVMRCKKGVAENRVRGKGKEKWALHLLD